jgi:hypothetical protein
MIQDFVNDNDDLVGQSFEGTNSQGDRLTLKVILRLRFAGSYVVFKRTHCGEQRQAEHPDRWLVLTSEQLRSDNLDFVTVPNSCVTRERAKESV